MIWVWTSLGVLCFVVAGFIFWFVPALLQEQDEIDRRDEA